MGANHVCVWGTGDLHADIMLIGEAPGQDEDHDGKPFVGRAGRELDTILAMAGIDRASIYLTNLGKCWPRGDEGTRAPKPVEVDACFLYLADELQTVQPKVIVAIGGSAFTALTGHKDGITKGRGVPVHLAKKYRSDVPVIGTFHPASWLHNPANRDRNMAAMVEDLQRAERLATGTADLLPHKRALIYDPVSGPAQLEQALHIFDQTEVLSCDCEWTKRDPTSVPWSRQKKQQFAYPWTKGTKLFSVSFSGKIGNAIYSVGIRWPEVGERCLPLLRAFLKKHWLIFHMGMGDMIWLYAQTLTPRIAGDTGILGHHIDDTQSLALEDLAQKVSHLPPWKTALWSHAPQTEEGWIELLGYNTDDTYATLIVHADLHAWRKRLPREEAESIRKIYGELSVPAIPPLARAALEGAPLSRERIEKSLAKTRAERIVLVEEFAQSVKVAPHIAQSIASKPAQTKAYFMNKYNIELDGTNVLQMKLIADKVPEAKLVSEIRSRNKDETTYELPWLRAMDDAKDERLHSIFRTTVARTNRASSSSEGYGASIHQAKRGEYRKWFVAPDGWVFIAADQAAVEMRIVAWIAGETRLLEIFNAPDDFIPGSQIKHSDVHAATGAYVRLLTTDPIPVSQYWPNRERYMIQITSDDRQGAKGVNFGFMFGMQEEKFILTALKDYDVVFTMEQAELAKSGYYELYPRIPIWHADSQKWVDKGYVVTPLGYYRRGVKDLTQAINTPVQTTASQITELGMVECYRNRDQLPQCKLVAFNHDELLFLSHEDHAEANAKLVKQIMENPNLQPFGIQRLPVKLLAETTIGKEWHH